MFNPYLETVEQAKEDSSLTLSQLRPVLTNTLAYGIPGEKAIETIVDHSPIVEVGAGTGYWAWMIEQAGGDVRAIDPNTDAGYTDVEKVRHDNTRIDDDRTLFICWAAHRSDWATEITQQYGGDTVIVVMDFHRDTYEDGYVHTLDSDPSMSLSKKVEVPQWPWLDDHLRVYTR